VVDGGDVGLCRSLPWAAALLRVAAHVARLLGVDWTEKKALLALHATPGLGPKRIAQLIAAMGSACAVVKQPQNAAARANPRLIRMPSAKQLEDFAKEQLAASTRCGSRVVIRGDSTYPKEFEQLEAPPPLFHVLGNVEILAAGRSRIAVIGARGCTAYGREQAQRFGTGFAFGGEVIVSGAARGIDQLAMNAAVQSQGAVIAVLGSGLDQPYPTDCWPLLERLLDCDGAILSEFPFGMIPKPGNFPRRNRLIAALSKAVLVIQATRKSGTMNTVGWALGLGREIFALPGPVDDVASSGTNILIHDGAGIALSPEEMLLDLNNTALSCGDSQEPQVLQLLAHQDMHPMELARESGLNEEVVRLQLVDFELRGQVIRQAGGHYHRCGPRP
jgi:DNA processing protein